MGADGVLIVDAKMAVFAEKVKAAIEVLGGDNPRFILDTHSHDDHINGNPISRRPGRREIGCRATAAGANRRRAGGTQD